MRSGYQKGGMAFGMEGRAIRREGGSFNLKDQIRKERVSEGTVCF